mmetsp:Transcript_63866/g.149958  ORF Transcript_63866/g.149958 Transcript_63866/m.149958 type:complete len:585 (+) Transcript_63866:73-1827(+)
MGCKAAKAQKPEADWAQPVQVAPPVRTFRGTSDKEYTQEHEAAASRITAVARGSVTRWQVKQEYHETRGPSEGDPVDPSHVGFVDYVQKNVSMPSVSDTVRFKVRDVTKQKVLKELGHSEEVGYWNSFETLAAKLLAKVASAGCESLPPGPKRQMSMTHLFNDEVQLEKVPDDPAEGFVARRQDQYLLGKYQIVAVPARADYDSAFSQVPQAKAENSPSHDTHMNDTLDCDGLEGFNGWFWVLHAAAPNIGESAHADDFVAYSVEEETDITSPVRTESVKSTASTASRCCWKDRLARPARRLNEDLYIGDISRMWRNVLMAMQHLQVEDVILFPFGMGAFLRHLNLNDDRYEDACNLRKLKRRIADGLMNAIVDVCMPELKAPQKAKVPLKVHLCLVCVNPESVDNHNSFVQAAAERAKQCPELKQILQLRRNVDSLQLAHELAKKQRGSKQPLKVALLNGANRKLCGNHWFQSGARYAIDENLHRRSASLSRASLLVNFDTEPRPRRATQLQETVRFFCGTVVDLVKVQSIGRHDNMQAVQDVQEGLKNKSPATRPPKAAGRKSFCLCGGSKRKAGGQAGVQD